jgi:4-hydroxy-3-polyprenylbenzoate decarboxylase
MEHRYLPVFSKRTTLRREVYDRVAARWGELGLEGQAPTVRAFEEDQNRVAYHEEGGFEPGAERRVAEGDVGSAPSM